ncbi:MAG: hypothetical protein EZS28_035007 [Streblomastix strix]|uniref:Uncharacterized protein n=1 Tax=Streblomastix strix TaxID=222440 RepID=A0A5J4UFB7_9EUKA|nr:MAG: hypothetical protein EZS28_035007 [Streblomastix strix]
MGQGNSITSSTNRVTTETYQESQEGMSLINSLDSARLAKLEVVHRTERDYKTEDMLRREGSKDGEKLFRQLLQARGLSSNAVDRVISNWSSQWRTHIAGLTLLAGYLKRINQQLEYLLNLEQPQIFTENYLEDVINQKCSDNSVKNQRCALAVLLKFMGYPDQQINSDQQRRAIAATLVMVFTVARLAELH